ncbi:MAG TPA: hypothetical protein VFG11_08850 [Acidobacteriota bacterium]|nr:hypothetical protein [Acidobacteriota bacterium]
MTSKILVLHDQSEEITALIDKLQAYGYTIESATTPEEVLEKAKGTHPNLFIGSGNFADANLPAIAEQIYDKYKVPAYLVLKSAGDDTEARMIRHPGIIGVYFSPVNVDRLFGRVRKFCQMLESPQAGS